MTASSWHFLPSFRGLVIPPRPGCLQLALERLDTSAPTTQLAPYAAAADPGGSGANDKSRQQQQQSKQIERQVDQKRQRPQPERYDGAVRDGEGDQKQGCDQYRRPRDGPHLPDPADDSAGLRLARTLVQSIAELLAGLEKRYVFFADPHTVASPRVAADPGISALNRECAKSTQFDAVAASQRRRYLVEDRRDDDFDIALVQMGVGFGKLLYELRFGHRPAPMLRCQVRQRAKPPGKRQAMDASAQPYVVTVKAGPMATMDPAFAGR